MFSGDIINGYWINLMAITAVTDLENHLFRQKTEIEWSYLNTVQLLCDSPLQKNRHDILALVYSAYSIDHLIFEPKKEIHVIVFFCLSNLMP